MFRFILATSVLVFFSFLTYGQDSITDTVPMTIKVRDFSDYGTYHHPDFENQTFVNEKFVGAHKGYIKRKINIKDDSTDYAGDERGPVLDSLYNATSPDGKIITSPTTFSDWYNDRDSTVNRSFLVTLSFLKHASGLLTYTNPSFFPLDKNGAKTSIYTPAWATFGDNDPPSYALYNWTNPGHDYGFTDELHCTFTYIKGKGQTFKFFGDDDVWVFIKDSLVVDIGGIHGEVSDSVNLDSLPVGFLKTGTIYPFDFFHAERHVTGSQVEITTSIALHPRVRTMILKAKVRDQNDTMTASDFERNSEVTKIMSYPKPLMGCVASKLDSVNQVPVVTPFALTHPEEFASTQTFYNWYHDADTNTNRPFHYDIIMQEVSPGIYGINWTKYFPLDLDSSWVPWNAYGPSPFGCQQKKNIWGTNPSDLWVQSHDWGFTTEIHSMVTYTDGANQYFVFGGDDDLWAFINDSLVMDMGGVHSILYDTLFLDKLPAGFLVDGQQYKFDLFHAERMVVSSDLVMLTNFQLDTYDQTGVPTQVVFANKSDYSDATSINNFVVTGDTIFIQVYDDPTPSKQVTITVIANGDRENAVLNETPSRGTYRGFIVCNSSDKTSNDGILGVGIGQKISYNYVPISKTPPTLVKNFNITKANRFMISNEKVFSQTAGTLTLFSLNGQIISKMKLDGKKMYKIQTANKAVLYSFKSESFVKNGIIIK